MKEHQRAWRTSFRTPQHGAFNRYSIPILPIAALLILLTSAVAARAEELLLPLLRSQMGEEASAQKQVVEELRRLPTTQSLELVQINTNALRAASTQLSIPNLSTITLSKSYDNVTDPTNFTWYGTLTGIPGQATLVVHNNNVTGSIQDGATFYRIEPVGNGVHALIKVDRERFPLRLRQFSSIGSSAGMFRRRSSRRTQARAMPRPPRARGLPTQTGLARSVFSLLTPRRPAKA